MHRNNATGSCFVNLNLLSIKHCPPHLLFFKAMHLLQQIKYEKNADFYVFPISLLWTLLFVIYCIIQSKSILLLL